MQQWCGYTQPLGAPDLRSAIAASYETIDASEVLVTSCAEEAIFLVYHALLDREDEVVVETPCYQSALSVAHSTGATVKQWRQRYENGWLHDVNALREMVSSATRLLYINQPHNPTGSLMDRELFGELVQLVSEHGLVLFGDEVYRELEHDERDRLPAVCDISPRGISLGSVSKSFGLPGVRIGWIATHEREILERVAELKDYTTICSSAPSEFLATVAIRNRHAILARSLELVLRNKPLLEEFFERHGGVFEWIPPVAGPIGFPRIRDVRDVDWLCEQLAHAGILLLPGSVYDEPEHVRVGFGRIDLPEALELLDLHLERALRASRRRGSAHR
jgi:aspartate/methionine/tyrosine aminotransferase